MQIDSYRELEVLEELSRNPSPTQRHLSKKLGVALGLTNLMIRRFVKKGYLKIVSLQKNRIQYLLTPQGVREKSRLTYEYLEYSMHLFRSVRQILKETLTQVAERGGKNIVYFGLGELAEIAYLSVKEAGLNMVAVVDDAEAPGHFLDVPIISVKELQNLSFDCGIVSSLHSGWDKLGDELRTLGIFPDKVVVIEQNGGDIKALLPEGFSRTEEPGNS